MQKILLSGAWNAEGKDVLSNESVAVRANVPGSALNDVVMQNMEGCDPFWRDNAEKFQKYENYNWHYTREFDIEKIVSNAELVFEKLDTYCDIYLNDTHLGYCENGHISYTFKIDNILKEGKNILEVFFYSPVIQTMGKKTYPAAFTTDRMHTRRSQCTYGWDWAMRFVSCGIGGDVYINMYDKEARIDNVYIYTKSIDAIGAYIGINVEFGDNFKDKVYNFDIYDPDGVKIKSYSKRCSYEKYNFNVDISDAKLWYPAGYGEQPLYELVISWEGKKLFSEKFGIRTVKIVQETDRKGSDNYNKCVELKKSRFSQEYDNNTEFSGFILVVNGVKILCRGANWVPCEPFETGKTREKISNILELSKEMGLNMIRVWGGATFEIKHFYEECSRLGIMVTQDFLMACGIYPEKEEWFIRQLNREAEYAAKLIRNQPCLLWWSGDNENAIKGNDTMPDYSGRDSAYYGIYPVLMQLDPQRDFLASSPYGGSFYASNTVGTTHITQYLFDVFDVIESTSLEDYKERVKKLNARFIAEEPTFGAASTYSNLKFMSEEDIYDDTQSMMKYHTKSNPGLAKHLYDYLLILTEKILGTFKDCYDRNFKLKYIQYECVRIFMEQLRRERWFCSGVIFWMLEECWPAAAGWGFIDYYMIPKASYYSFKRCSKPVVCLIDREENYVVSVCNDGLEPFSGDITVYTLNKSGEKECLYKEHITVGVGETYTAYSFENNGSLFFAEINGENVFDRAFYKEGLLSVCRKDVAYTVDEVNRTITFNAGDDYIHAVEIEGNLILSNNYFQLMPGENKIVTYKKVYEDKPIDIIVSAYGLEA